MKTSGKSWSRYIDKKIKAKKVGWRKSSETGERYYEARPDHSDENPKERYAKGGNMKKSTFKYHKVANQNLWAIKECDLNGENCGIIRIKKSEMEAKKEVARLNKQGYSEYSMAKGGKTKKRKDPPIVRGYFEDEPYEYGSGGAISVGDKVKIRNTNKTMVVKNISKGKKGYVEFTGSQGTFLKGDLAKFEKGGMMARGGNTDDTPKIYVADLEAYNNGKLKGQWVDLSDYDNGEEVMQKIGEIVGDNEYAIHDYENFSSSLYSESMGEDDFDKVIQVYKVSEEKGIPANVLGDIMREYEPDDLEEWIDEHYEGQFDSDTDLAYHYVDVLGGVDQLGEETLQRYFDYESFGRDLAYDYGDYDGHYFRRYAKGGTMSKSYDLKKYVFNTGFNYSIGGL